MAANRPLVSVIIPTFNRRQLVVRAIESVLAQSYTDFELIVVDDGSCDGTAQRLSEFANRLHLITTRNQGVSAARNLGAQHAQGQWLAWLDSDDSWHPSKLQQQIAALETNPDYVLCHTNEMWVRHGRRVNPQKKHEKFGGWIYQRCLPLCLISPSSCLIAKVTFDQLGGFDQSLPACEDYDLWLRVTCCHPVLYLEQPLITKYGGHEDQLSAKYWGMDRFRIHSLRKMLDSGKLNELDCHATQRVLRQKLTIYLQGLAKRNKLQEYATYQKQLESLPNVT